MIRIRTLYALFVTASLIGLAAPALAQDFSGVQIAATKVTDNVYMLTGRGGNIGLCVGDDGAFLIDDQYAPLTDRILAAVKQIIDKPVRFVVNTHWHGDHTGGNENLGNTGAILVAHENVRKRLSTEQFMEAFDRHVPPSPEAALPIVTFTDGVTFHYNGEEIRVQHVAPAHTDGDAIIHFMHANVIHTGDVYFSNGYPFIDVSSGGQLEGMIAATDRVLSLANDDTKIIPGHGDVSNAAELRVYRRMLSTAAERIGKLVKAGKTREETIAAKPTADLDEKWGGGFMKPDVWVGIVYDGFKKNAAKSGD